MASVYDVLIYFVVWHHFFFKQRSVAAVIQKFMLEEIPVAKKVDGIHVTCAEC